MRCDVMIFAIRPQAGKITKVSMLPLNHPGLEHATSVHPLLFSTTDAFQSYLKSN